MKSILPNIIQYFHDCYRSDNRELVVFDFLDRKVEDRVIIEGKEELVNNEYPIVPINSEKAINILKKLEVFEKEKELLYGTFFLCGYYVDFKGESKRLCSPLFYYPAEIHFKDEFHYLSIREQERRLNFPLLSMLSKDTGGDILNDPIFKQLPKDYIRFEDVGLLISLFQKYLPNVELENIYSYPNNFSLKFIKSAISKVKKEGSSKTVLLPTSMLGIVSKSTNTRGVLNELSDLSSLLDYSEPLKKLFNITVDTPVQKTYQKGKIPMILSEAQQALLKSSSINPLTLIVGPPGTGKSYTIGAIAIEHMSRGESVLIASRTDEAVDVIKNKLSDSLGIDRCVVRGGKKRAYSTPLNRYLKALLTRVSPLKYLVKEFGLPRKTDAQSLLKLIADLTISIDRRSESINELEKKFLKEVDNEIEWGSHLGNESRGNWHKFKTLYLNFRNKIQTPIWEYTNELFEKDDEQTSEVLELIRLGYVSQVLSTLEKNWKTVNDFYEALKLSSDTERLNKFEEINFKTVLKTFPIWLTNLSEVKDVLPFEKEMFDVVIIDEATQCDIASCLPLIQRAKRVVFAGDPNQLRHVSFLSRSIQAVYSNKYNLQSVESLKLNFREKSILDLAMNSLQSGKQVAMLDEHFRSIAPIISFSNKKFYGNELRIMTSRPDEQEQGLYFISCEGKRGGSGTNEKEAHFLLKNIREVIDEERELSLEYSTSIGILSPFRAQVDFLGKQLMNLFTIEEISKHNIRVGTAYSFQGEERDQMYLSFVVDKESHHSAFNHINKEDVFNVSITRARNKQFVYLSVNEKDLKSGSLFRSYLSGLDGEVVGGKDAYYDKFLHEVNDALQSWGIQNIWFGFPIAGLKVDVLLKYKNDYIGVDLVGYPGEFEDTFGIDRFRVLNRAGIKVLPLPYSDWYFENDKTKSILKKFILKL